MLVLNERIRVKKTNNRLAGWEGKIKYINNAYYFIQFDKTPLITVMLNHDSVEKAEQEK